MHYKEMYFATFPPPAPPSSPPTVLHTFSSLEKSCKSETCRTKSLPTFFKKETRPYRTPEEEVATTSEF